MDEHKKGMLFAVGAYAIWGIIPLFWKLLEHVSSIEILMSRVIWSFVLTTAFVLIIGQRKHLIIDLRFLWKNQKQFWSLFAASIIVSTNWGIYIWAVNNDHIIESSLGYYINPLISVLFGFLFFKESISKATVVSVSIAAIGVMGMIVSGGTVPWIALMLALTFATYGVLKKKVQLNAVRGLAIETMFVVPIAVVVYIYLMQTTDIAFMHIDVKTTLLLIASGLVTAIPLVLFALGAQRIPLYLMGFIQFLSPTLGLFLGIVVFEEPFTNIELFTFVCIWIAVVIFSVSKFIEARKRHMKH